MSALNVIGGKAFLYSSMSSKAGSSTNALVLFLLFKYGAVSSSELQLKVTSKSLTCACGVHLEFS